MHLTDEDDHAARKFAVDTVVRVSGFNHQALKPAEIVKDADVLYKWIIGGDVPAEPAT